MSRQNEPVEVELYLCAETDKAMCFKTELNRPGQRDKKQVWLPRSQIEVSNTRREGDNYVYTVTMPEWLALDKGLI